jgi:hypothetical protein
MFIVTCANHLIWVCSLLVLELCHYSEYIRHYLKDLRFPQDIGYDSSCVHEILGSRMGRDFLRRRADIISESEAILF